MSIIKILFLGDIVGSSGRKIVKAWTPILRKQMQLDFVIANAENSAHGFGVTPQVAAELFQAEIDCLTGGNHTFDKKEVNQCFQEYPDRVLRPANYPPGTSGKGVSILHTKSGHKIGVINLMGRIFMDPIDCPFQIFEKEIESVRRQTPIVFLDMHAEASSEKQAMARFADGRISCFVGTHTHVPTADERILPKGTGYLTDCGMNGPYDSIIGMKTEIIVERFVRKQHIRMEVSDNPGSLRGVVYQVDTDDGKCVGIERVHHEKMP